MTEKVDTSTLAFTWAAMSAAETVLICLSRNRPKVRDHAQLLINFVDEGNLGQPPHHYIEKMAKTFPDLAAYRVAANNLVDKLKAEAMAQAAE